ncbi:MAG: sel1 repeat family protein [Gammaproteobacteria bacterium]|nr:sel1 repeat family protein [Gammaproteobacteria bacterium]MBL6999895.1 sel1 repeat family protein [Gammaproteobacteria bacterium]
MMTTKLLLLLSLLWISPILLATDVNDRCRYAFDDSNYAQAKTICLQAAEQGFAEAQTLLGEMYDRGLGVEVNAAEVKKWWQLASQQSYLPAQNLLALKFYYGGDVFGPQPGWSQDFQQAAAIWQLSAGRGVASSQFMLGEIYLRGQGVETDLAESYAWFSLALQGGYKLATDSLIELSRVISSAQKKQGQLRQDVLNQQIKGRTTTE